MIKIAKKSRKKEEKETLSADELKVLISAADEEIEKAIKERDTDKDKLHSQKDELILRIKTLSDEAILLDEELKEFYKLSSKKIMFDLKTLYRVLLRRGMYKRQNTVLVDFFINEVENRKKLDELLIKGEEFLQELSNLEVNLSQSEDKLIKAVRKHDLLCVRLKAVEDTNLLEASRSAVVDELVDDSILSTNQSTTVDVNLTQADEDYKFVEEDEVKCRWTRFVEFLQRTFKKLFSKEKSEKNDTQENIPQENVPS